MSTKKHEVWYKQCDVRDECWTYIKYNKEDVGFIEERPKPCGFEPGNLIKLCKLKDKFKGV